MTGNALNNIDLETDADDWSNYILQYKSDGLVSIANIHSSYHSRIKSHTIKLFLSEVTISADFQSGLVKIQNDQKSIDKRMDLKVERDYCFKQLLLDVINSRDDMGNLCASISKFVLIQKSALNSTWNAMRVNQIAIIPARKNSKSIPNKNIIKFNGKPLIHWSIKVALEANCFDKIIVSSDSDDILDYAINKMQVVGFKRPKELCDDMSRDIDIFNI